MPQIVTIITCCLFMAAAARAARGTQVNAKQRVKR